MAGIGNTYIDLIDIYKQTMPDGTDGDYVDQLRELNPMMMDAYAVECNNGTSHRHKILTGLPDTAFGKLYKGIAQGKSQFAQVDDTTGFIEGLSTVDERVLKSSKNPAAVRMTEARVYMESMAQKYQSSMLYSNDATAPEEFMGFAPRFSDTTAKNGSQIVLAGGAGADNTSIWMITWSDMACHTLYPKGTTAGFTREDKGSQRTLDDDGNPYYVKEEYFCMHVGLAVKDWRYVTRIANIDVSAMQADPSNIDGSNNSLYDFLRKAYYKHEGRRHPLGKGRTFIYMNSDCMEALDALGTNKGANDNYVRLGRKEIQGEEVPSYRNFAVRETDAILNTEALVA